MRTVNTAGGEAAQPTSSRADLTDAVKVEVANSSDTLVDLTEFVVSVEYDETTDEIVNAATVVFRRQSGASSLAPLMTADPPLDLNRRIVISVNPGAGTYKEVFRGVIDDVDWPKRFGDVTIECRDQGADAADTFIESVSTYGSDAGVPLETVMQSVADASLASSPTIYAPTATSAVVTPAYEQQQESVLAAERTLADAIGWTIRWRYIDSLSAWRWTLFEPSRSKSAADHTFGTDDYWDVSVMRQNKADIRNVIEVEYSDAAADGARDSRIVEGTTSIAKYGRRYMKISEASDSPVNNSTLATALANAALSDLQEPDALLEITCRYFWPGEIGVDLYEFTANGEHFSSDQTLAAMSFRHRIAIGERPTTKILTRGKPSGGVLMWRRKERKNNENPPREPDDVYGFTSFIRRNKETSVEFEFTVGSKVSEVWYVVNSYDQEAVPDNPYPDKDDPELSAYNVLVVGTDDLLVTIDIPTFGNVKYAQFEARKADLSFGPGNTLRRVEIMPNTVDTPMLVDEAVIAAKLADAAVERAKILDGAINDLKLASAAVTAAKVAVGAIEEDKIAALAVTAGKIGAGAVETAKLANLAVTEAILAAGAVTTTKVTDLAISTPKLAAGAVTAAKITAGTITSNEIAANTIVAGNIAAGTITTTEIAALTIVAGNIAASTITGGKIAALTIEGGNIAAETIAAGKLVSNTITATQIAADAITASELSADSVTADKILAGEIEAIHIAVGGITANRIDVSTLTAWVIENSAGDVGISMGTTAIDGDYDSYISFNKTDRFIEGFGSKFWVDHLGNMTAESATITGTLAAGSILLAEDFQMENLELSEGGRIVMRPAGTFGRAAIDWLDGSDNTIASMSTNTGGISDLRITTTHSLFFLTMSGTTQLTVSAPSSGETSLTVRCAGTFSGNKRVQIDGSTGNLYVS